MGVGPGVSPKSSGMEVCEGECEEEKVYISKEHKICVVWRYTIITPKDVCRQWL